MKKYFFLFIVGVFFMGVAIFAETLGLDRNPGGWGRARIAMFIFGTLVVLAVAAYLVFKEKIDRAAQNIYLLAQSHPLTSWVWKNEFMLRLSRFFRNYSFTLPVMIFILVLYVWLVSAGTWTEWVSPTRYYASLAKGFEFGTLSVMMQPDPRLAELENPYDPVNWRGTIQVPMDISYYQGRFYLYWGPAPAFILYLLHPFYSGRIGDLYLAFVFICGIFLSQFILIISVWDRFFSGLPRWMLQISLLLAGLACPLTFMLAGFKGARIYEAAISGGQFFLLAGFLVVLTVLNKPGYSSSWRLLLAGTLWIFSFGSRLTLVFSIAFIVLMVAYWFYRARQPLSMISVKLFLLCLPLCIGLASIGWYNWARFGSVSESGLYYQLTAGLYLQKYNKEMIDPIYALQNIYNYLFYPFDLSSQFPFLSPRYTYSTPIFPFYPLPELYNGQWITGLVWTVPFAVFAFFPLTRTIRDLSRKRSPGSQPESDRAELNWFVLTLGGTFLSAFVFLLIFFWAAMRYLADFTPLLVVLSVIGFWQGYQLLSEKPVLRRFYVTLGLTAACISMVSSTLLAISVNDAQFLLIRLFPFLG